LPDFFSVKQTKTGENVPNNHKIYPNGHKTYTIAVTIPNDPKIYKHFPFQAPQKYAQIVIFGVKIYHLATPMYIHT
jgi:hypothetical protein